MKSKTALPWILASLPLAVILLWLLPAFEAALYFGHFPRYMADPDPFHNEWASIFPDWLAVLGLLVPLLLLPWAICLAVSPFRYRGGHPIAFYSLVAAVAFLTWYLTWHDATGFLQWSLD